MWINKHGRVCSIFSPMDYRHTMAKSLKIQIPNKYLECGYKGLVFSRNKKWVLINRPKISQMPQNLSAQFVCPNSKVWDFDEKNALLGVRSPWMH